MTTESIVEGTLREVAQEQTDEIAIRISKKISDVITKEMDALGITTHYEHEVNSVIGWVRNIPVVKNIKNRTIMNGPWVNQKVHDKFIREARARLRRVLLPRTEEDPKV